MVTSPQMRSGTMYRRGLLIYAAVTVLAGLLVGSSSPLVAAGAQQSAAAPAQAKETGADERVLLTRYCVTCHNDKLKTAGLVIDPSGTSNVPAGADVWEKVIRKLRTGQMPPPGRPRPDNQQVQALATYLETAIDRDAAARPNPGRTEAIHRLTRAEYRNAVRDLFALDVDVASLLPADDMSYGFDNIGGVLKITPSL